MVSDDALEAEGQDRQGRDAARALAPHADVQLPRVQRLAPPLTVSAAPTLTARPDTKVVYRRYASLFFVAGISQGDNELVVLEVIHRFVEVLDRYFGNVSCSASLS